LIFNRKMEIIFSKEDEAVLDGQSKICNWLYNHLLEMVKEDYKNGNKNEYLKGRNLRDQVPKWKEIYPFLKTVHSSPLKNTALRLKDAYSRVFKQNNQPPKFRSWKKKWFSLYYDEPNKGVKFLDSKTLQITLGKNKDNKQLYVTGTLKESLSLQKDDKIKNFRLCKQQGNRFYAIFCIERNDIKPKENQEKWISIDPNHKNFFTAVDFRGETFEFAKLAMIKYWDRQIDKMKSKRDKCQRKVKQVKTQYGNTYSLPSKRWERLNQALDRVYHRRREQIKSALYAIANWMAKHYDVVVIGDYSPSLETAKYDNMHRSMLNQEVIGRFRHVLSWVMKRSGKECKVIHEKDMTKTCCVCGHKEKKDPSIRMFTCPNCKNEIGRDINSAMNIAKKANMLQPNSMILKNLSHITHFMKWNVFQSNIQFV
jgi:putative transposase